MSAMLKDDVLQLATLLANLKARAEEIFAAYAKAKHIGYFRLVHAYIEDGQLCVDVDPYSNTLKHFELPLAYLYEADWLKLMKADIQAEKRAEEDQWLERRRLNRASALSEQQRITERCKQADQALEVGNDQAAALPTGQGLRTIEHIAGADQSKTGPDERQDFRKAA